MSEKPFTSLARTSQELGAHVGVITAITEVVRSWLGTTPSSLEIVSALQTTKADTADILRGQDSLVKMPVNPVISETPAADDTSYNLAA